LPRGCHRHAWIRGSLFASSVARARLTWPRFCIWFPSGFTPRLFDFAQSTAKTNTVEILAGDCNVPIDGGRGPLGTRQGYSRRRPSSEDRSAGCLPRRCQRKSCYRPPDYMHLTKLNGQWRMLDVVLQIQAVNRFHYFSRPFRSSITWSAGFRQDCAGFRQGFPDSQFSPPPASRKKRGRTPQMTSI
jgi:hypothetical protein